MAINPSNVLKLLVMRFLGHQSTEDYSNFEEEIANGIFDYLEDIMEDRGDQLVKAFSEDDDDAEVSDDEDGTLLERFHGYNRKQMFQIVENWFVRKHKFGTIKSKFRKVRQTTTIYRFVRLFMILSTAEGVSSTTNGASLPPKARIRCCGTEKPGVDAQPSGLVYRTTVPGDDQTRVVQVRISRRTLGRIRHSRKVLFSIPEFGRELRMR